MTGKLIRFNQRKRSAKLASAKRVALALAIATSTAMGVSAQRPNQPQLKHLNVPGSVADSVATRLSLQYLDQPGVTITPDDRPGGGLLVLAPPDLQNKIAADAATLSNSLAQVAGPQSATPITVHLVNITWREVEDALRIIAGEDVPVTTSRNGERASFTLTMEKRGGTTTRVEVDRRSNAVTLTTSPLMHNTWRKTIQAIDQAPRFAGEETRVYMLQHAKISSVQRAIRLLRDLDPKSGSGTSARPASNRTQANFRTAAFQNEGGTAAPDGAADVAAADSDSEGDDAAGPIGDPEIQFVPESGLIIVKGNKRDIQRVMDIVKDIEEKSKLTQPEIQVRQLQHADSNAVSALLTQLYEDVLSARQGDVSITALDSPNALLLIGRKEAIEAVNDLIEKIDQPIPDSDRLRVFRLQHASATDAEATIQGFFTNQPGGDEENRPGLGVRVRVTADYRTNSLIVSASPRDLAEVTRLVEEIDVQKIASTAEIKVFPLTNARAEDMVEVLQDAISGEPENIAGDTTAAASSLSIVSLSSPGNKILDSGVLNGAVITADSNVNAVVVRAPAGGMPLIAELIRQLDQTPGIDSLVKVFTIENGDATQLTTALQNLFGDDAATNGTSVGAGNLGNLQTLTASESALTPLVFSTDIRTNSIIASGSAEDLEVVESILLRLDSEGFAERITEVIWLKHQIAENVAAAITNYVSQRQQSRNVITQFQQGLGPLDLPDRDIVAVAEAQTNSVLLSVSPRIYEEVRQLIDRLDRRPPMVLIKTLIAEVELDDGFEIGGEFGLQDSLLFDRGKATGAIANPASDPGFNFGGTSLPNSNSFGQESLASQGLTSFGSNASQLTQLSGLNSGGFVFSAASESVNLFLRTLRVANRLQILSRPEIMTADNTEGYVQVGQSFPRPTELSFTGGTGGTASQPIIGIEDEEIGIILRVTPRVGADGLIMMAIDASRSDINPNEGQIIGSFQDDVPIFVPAIDRTQAQATVTAFDGQTVVFGGLIQKFRQNRTRRVPYLADIPLVGTFFKYDSEIETRSELLVVMTPILVTGHEDLEYVKQVESSRMSWCLADVVEMHGDVGLSGGYGLWGPAVGPTIYPDLHPTVDVFPAADMPGGNRAMKAGVIPPGSVINSVDGNVVPGSAGQLPPDVTLNPGESIIRNDWIEAPQGSVPTPQQGLPVDQLPAPVMSAPGEFLPAPVSGGVPATGAGFTGATPTKQASNGATSQVPVKQVSARMPSQPSANQPTSTPPADTKPVSEEVPAKKRWFNFNRSK
ncbi:General secretion pathway protein D [Rhodopirellula islandica]|uniref:General secretion pathway protein D n=1 Tax=Rhodopirellula islandica TaxID=595434 RepID=A0A0J1BL72_RHOIS|nr:secretin N-terminal domain-containing protein [Rhodopirellula islandica]KLU07286.1 General secretion pathway protein D [Rhodopirellula islandica]